VLFQKAELLFSVSVGVNDAALYVAFREAKLLFSGTF